ncbi:hypothetical protein B0O99DRAFT_651614 [Bisporella sp. PMI_857]|nr:hypothetical protein B0O99DRAFT_651614 [Bisporella sp. PMI_857]
MTKVVAFFGASAGVGLSALKQSIAAGHECIALCRFPSKLTAIFPAETTPNLTIVQGDAKDLSTVSKCIQKRNGELVDQIISTIGAKPIISKLSIDDPEVCRKGMFTLLGALEQLRRAGATGQPYIIVFSTTGMSRFGRDVPLAMVPLYHIALKVPHQDKRIMEDSLAASGEDFTIVRGSLLTNGASTTRIRVGIEDPKTGRESNAIGYTISREDAGRWISENLVVKRDAQYLKKVATITY